MKKRLKFRPKVFGLAALLMIGLIAIQALLASYVNEQVRQKEYVGLLFEELEASIGYRGLIHHFKNAVLRPDSPSYIGLAEERGTRALDLIALLEREAMTLGVALQDNALQETKTTIIAYLDRLPIVRDGHATHRTILEIDRLLAVDDVPATQELSGVRSAFFDTLDSKKTQAIYLAGALQILLASMITLGFIYVSTQRIEMSRQQVELLNDKVLLLNQNLELKRIAEDAGTYLRDPITQAVTVSDMLTDETESNAVANRKLLGLLKEISEDMLKRVTTILECVRTEEVTDAIKTQIDMKELVSSARHEVLRLYGKKHTIIIGNMPDATANRDLLRLMWESLIESAVRFTKAGAAADILIHGWLQDDMVIYTIKDRGVWMDKEKIMSLVNLTPTPDGAPSGLGWRDGSDNGNGIGLALAKSVVNRHGGDITLDNDYKEGLCFRISLPHIKA